MESADVIIVGAGAAGLAAGARLTAAGFQVLLLEARDRIGGRILADGLEPDGAAVELGAEFVHGRPPEIFGLAGRAGLEIREIEGQPWISHNGTVQPAEAFFDSQAAVFERLEQLVAPDRSFLSFLHDCCADLPEEARRQAISYVEGFHAAYAGRISAFSIRDGEKAEQAIDGDRQFRIAGGYGRLADALLADIDPSRFSLELRQVVSEVNWQKPRVEIRTESPAGEGKFSAAAAIVTLPLSLLQASAEGAGGVRFTPGLTAKRAALELLEMGRVVRVVLRFREAFWRDLTWQGKPASDMTFLFGADLPFPTWWTAWPSPAPLLTGWAAGPRSQIGAQQREELELAAVSSLARTVNRRAGVIRGLLEEFHFHDWQADPFSRGAYSYVKTGGADSAQAELARPLGRRLFFAGEATCSDGHHATVHGAIATGIRAADEVMQAWRAR